MNRRNFLSSFISVPVVVAGIGIEGLLAPRRTIFLPPRGGWRCVQLNGGYFYSRELVRKWNEGVTPLVRFVNAPPVTLGYAWDVYEW